ncbi:TPA: hypothetical protein DF272_02885 [Candidatus Falkowbacteria bacterium]|nr:hypothetical protein [Candidatus Falkowbacteria bacterium]
MKYMGDTTGDIIIVPPVVELFSRPELAKKLWPDNIASNREFQTELVWRRKLNERLDAVISRLPKPGIELEQAVHDGFLDEITVAEMYASLSDLLEDSTDYQRIILYLPFEFLPDVNWKSAEEKLRLEITRFRIAYMTTWNNLLSMLDVRANFVDGDVMDVEKRVNDLPRVVKAAHLIPKLVEKGFLTVGAVFHLLEQCEEETLRKSIEETLPVLADMGFIKSHDVILEPSDEEAPPVSVKIIQERLAEQFFAIERDDFGDILEKRIAWLIKDRKRQAIEKTGNGIKNAILSGTLDLDEAVLFADLGTKVECQLAFIDGVRKAVEASAETDLIRATSLYTNYKEQLLALWKCEFSAVRDALTKAFFRLHSLKIVTDTSLELLGLTVPALSGPFSANLRFLQPEIAEIRKIIKVIIETDAELSSYIYPVFLIYGSRLKGYGDKTSDCDAAIFVRQNTDVRYKETIKELLNTYFAQNKIINEVVMFWLDKDDNDALRVHDFDDSSPLLGESHWTHVLFGAVWVGTESAIHELRNALLVPYFYDNGRILHNRKARKIYIEELERDSVQYRLMHRGFAKFYPRRGGIKTPHASLIDGHSRFWDSGYRLTATRLYASRVFLPQIVSSEKAR